MYAQPVHITAQDASQDYQHVGMYDLSMYVCVHAYMYDVCMYDICVHVYTCMICVAYACICV